MDGARYSLLANLVLVTHVLFVVFAITWAGFFAYIFFVSRKQRELQREVVRLRVRLDDAETPDRTQ